MAAPCCLWRQKFKILRCGKSWTKCVASLSQANGKNKTPSSNVLEEKGAVSSNPDQDGKGSKRNIFQFERRPIQLGSMDSWLQWNMNINDTMSMKAYLEEKKYMQLKKDQMYLEERTQVVGTELGAAHFIVANNGAVKLQGRDVWFAKNKEGKYSLPRVYVKDLFVEAIDASNTNLTYVAFDSLEGLEKLRFLRLHNCPHIDDWCLSRLHRLQNSLEFLDLSDLTSVTDQGLISLHNLHNLKCLKLSNLPKVKHLGLITLLLEEQFPELQVLGVKEEDMKPPQWSHRGERRLVRALLGLTDGEQEEQDFREFGNIGNESLKRYSRIVDTD